MRHCGDLLNGLKVLLDELIAAIGSDRFLLLSSFEQRTGGKKMVVPPICRGISLLSFLCCWYLVSSGNPNKSNTTCTVNNPTDTDSFHGFKTKFLNGSSVDFAQYKNKVVLLFNAATF